MAATDPRFSDFLSGYTPPPDKGFDPGFSSFLQTFEPPEPMRSTARPSPAARPAGLARIPVPPREPDLLPIPGVQPIAAPRTSHSQESPSRRLLEQAARRGGVPSEEATTENLYEQPGATEAFVNAVQRGTAKATGALGGLVEMTGRMMQPDEEPERPLQTLAQQEAMAKMRDIYSVGAPPTMASSVASAALGSQIQQHGEKVQERATREQEALPRPEYAKDFWSGMRTDPFKTLAISGLENLPTLVSTIGAAAVGGPVAGGAVAFSQEAGAAYQEAKASGATEDEARQVAGWVGATNMVLEYLPAGKLLKSLKGGDSVATKGVTRILLEQGMAEGGTETLQELNQVVANVALVAQSEGMSIVELGKRLGEAGLTGLVLGLAGGGASATTNKVRQSRQAVEPDTNLGPDRFEGLNEVLTKEREATETAEIEPPSYAPPDEDGVPRFGWKQAMRQSGSFPPDLDPWIAKQGIDLDELTHRDKGDLYAKMVAEEKVAHARQMEEGPPAPEPTPELTPERWEGLRAMNATAKAQAMALTSEPAPRDLPLQAEPPAALPDAQSPIRRRIPIKPRMVDLRFSRIPGELSPRTPTWAKSHEDSIDNWSSFVQAAHERSPNTAYVEIGVEDLPFDVVNLPITRWQRPDTLTGRLSKLSPVGGARNGKFYLLGDQTQYYDLMDANSLGGTQVETELFTPRSPLVLLRGDKFNASKSGDDRLIRSAEKAGHDALIIFNRDQDLGRIEVVKTRLAGQGLPRDRSLYRFLDEAEDPFYLQGVVRESLDRDSYEQAIEKFNGWYTQPSAFEKDGKPRRPIQFPPYPGDARFATIKRALGTEQSFAWKDLIGRLRGDIPKPVSGVAEVDPLTKEQRILALAKDLGRRPKLPEIQREFGVGKAEAKKLWQQTKGWNDEPRTRSGPDLPAGPVDGRRDATPAEPVRATESGPDAVDLPAREGDLATGVREPERGAATDREEMIDVRPDPPPSQAEPSGPDVDSSTAPRSSRDALEDESRVPKARAGDGGASLAARILSKPDEAGFHALPEDLGKDVVKFLRRNMTSAGLKPKWLLERISNRDGKLAAHADRLGRLSRDLSRAVEDYKGPLTQPQLVRYLDDAFRGMNLRTGGEALDATQIARIAAKRAVAPEALEAAVAREVPADKAGLAAAPEFVPIIRKMRAAQDALTRTLRRAGLLDDGVARDLERHYGLYAHRQYESVRNPKWRKRVKKEPLWERAFELTTQKWETDANRQRADLVAKKLKMAKPPEAGPVRAGDRVRVGQKVGTAIGPAETAGKIVVAFSREDFVEVDPSGATKVKGTREQAAKDVQHWLRGYTSLNSLAASYGLPEATIQAAYDDSRSVIPSKSADHILGIMDNYMERTGNQPAMPGGMPEGAKDLSVLRKRSSQDDLRRALMGEVKNIQSSFMTSSLKLAALIEQQSFLEDIAKIGAGDIFHKEPVRVGDESYSVAVDPDKLLASRETAKGEEPGIDDLPINKGKGRTSPLSGTFTSQDIIDELTDVFDDKNYPVALRAWMTASFAAKAAQTIGSVQSGNRNFLSNFAYIMGHGVNPFNARRFRTSGSRAYGRIFQHLHGRRARQAEALMGKIFAAKPDAETAAEVQRRLELGLYDQGSDVGDLKRLEKRSLLFRHEQPGAGSAAGKVVRSFGNWYQSHDNYAKDFVFDAQVSEYQDALGVSRKEAEEYVAGKLRDTMQNYSRVPRLVRAVSTFPVIGPFLSFSEEVYRNTKNLIPWIAEELKSDNPKIRALGKKKLVGLTTAYTIPIAASFAARYFLGMDDEDDEAVRKFMAPWSRNAQIMFLQHEAEDVTFLDWGFMDAFAMLKEPLLRLWNGDLDGAVESLARPLSEDLVTQKLVDIARNTTETGGEVYNPRETAVVRQLEKGAHVGKAFEPGTSRSIRRIADPERKTGYEILALFGPRITTINIPKELTRRAKQYKIDTGNDLWIEKKVVVRKGTEAKRERAAKRSEKRLRESVEWVMAHVAAARQLDIDEDRIEESLSGGGLGRWEVEMVMDGDIDGIIEHYNENVESWEEEREEDE